MINNLNNREDINSGHYSYKPHALCVGRHVAENSIRGSEKSPLVKYATYYKNENFAGVKDNLSSRKVLRTLMKASGFYPVQGIEVVPPRKEKNLFTSNPPTKRPDGYRKGPPTKQNLSISNFLIRMGYAQDISQIGSKIIANRINQGSLDLEADVLRTKRSGRIQAILDDQRVRDVCAEVMEEEELYVVGSKRRSRRRDVVLLPYSHKPNPDPVIKEGMVSVRNASREYLNGVQIGFIKLYKAELGEGQKMGDNTFYDFSGFQRLRDKWEGKEGEDWRAERKKIRDREAEQARLTRLKKGNGRIDLRSLKRFEKRGYFLVSELLEVGMGYDDLLEFSKILGPQDTFNLGIGWPFKNVRAAIKKHNHICARKKARGSR